MTKSRHPIIRMSPEEFGDWTSIREPGIIDDDAKSRGHLFLDRKGATPARVFSGLWEATAHVEKITDFDKDEIMFLLEGSFTITDDTGHAETFHPGDACLMPMGFTGEWRHDETVRKFYMIVDYGDAA